MVGTPQQTTILAWFGNHLRIPHSAPHSARCLFVPFVHFVTSKDNIYELFPEVLCSCGSGSEHNCRFGMPIFLCPVNTLALGTKVQSPLSRPLHLLHTAYYILSFLLLCPPNRLVNFECYRSLAVIDIAWR